MRHRNGGRTPKPDWILDWEAAEVAEPWMVSQECYEERMRAALDWYRENGYGLLEAIGAGPAAPIWEDV